MVITFFHWVLIGCMMSMCRGYFPPTTPPGERRSNLNSDSDIKMNIGTQLLMGVYITVAVLLSVVPFGIYMYIMCKKTRINYRLKRLINKARGIPDNADQHTRVIRWPYVSRETEAESGYTNSIFMIDLPTYDEVMKNAHLYSITKDVSVVYRAENSFQSHRTCSLEERNDNISQLDLNTLPEESIGFLEISHEGDSPSLPNSSNQLDNTMTRNNCLRTSSTQTGNINTVDNTVSDTITDSLSVTRL